MEPNYNLQQSPNLQTATPNKESDIFDLIIKISIPIIIILIITILLLIFKPWNSLNISTLSLSNTGDQSEELKTSKYLEISNPAYSLTGTISKIKTGVLFLEVSVYDGTTTIPININKNTSITHVPQASPLFSGDMETGTIQLSPNELEVNNNVVVSTVEDIRKYDGSPLNATIITVLNDITEDIVDSIDENKN